MIRPPAVGVAVAYSVDTQGILWLRVYDINGLMICICPIPAEGALQLADFIDEHYEAFEDDEMGEVAGHA
jgi:hypothetical protein